MIGVVATAVFVFVQGLLDVFVVLTGQPRILRIDGIAIGTVTGNTGCRLGFAIVGIAAGEQRSRSECTRAIPNESSVSARFMQLESLTFGDYFGLILDR
jgi:hypothetical protein